MAVASHHSESRHMFNTSSLMGQAHYNITKPLLSLLPVVSMYESKCILLTCIYDIPIPNTVLLVIFIFLLHAHCFVMTHLCNDTPLNDVVSIASLIIAPQSLPLMSVNGINGWFC